MTSAVVPLWALASCNDEVLSEDTDPDYLFEYVDISNVTQGAIGQSLDAQTFGSAPSRARRLARPGDVIVSTVRTYLRAIAEVGDHEEMRVYSTGFAVLRPRFDRVESRFLAYRLQADDFMDDVVAHSVGVSYPAITAKDLMRIRLTVPPVRRQRAIAEFLDRETAKIDVLIEKQSLLAERLRERRTALVLRAATGAYQHQALSSSGLFWAPHTPVNWEIKPLKRLLSEVQTGVWGADEDGGGGDVPCVRVADFDRKRLQVRAAPTIRNVSDADRRKCELQRHDLLIEKSGGTATNPVGFVAAYASDEPAVFANFIARLRMRDDQNPRYWLYALHGSYTGGLTWRSVKQTTGIQNLDLDAFLSEKFPVPSPPEQQEIVDRLDHETAKIDTLIAKTERMIELSRERRAALITAAVTGQVDVTKGSAA